MECRRDEDYTAASGGVGPVVDVGGSGGDEGRESRFKSVERSNEVNFHDRLESIGGQPGEGCKEVACSASAGVRLVLYTFNTAVYKRWIVWVGRRENRTYMTKSIPPSSLTQRSTAPWRLSKLRTSTAPMPRTFAPRRAVAIDLAIDSVFSTLRPMMQALAPRWTRART